MELKSIAVGVVATLLVLSAVGAGAFVAVNGLPSNNQADANESGHDHSSHEHSTTPTSTAEPVNEDEVPEDVKASLAGAKALKANLSDTDTFENASVSITKQGEVVVHYNSQASNGQELKNEMAQVAYHYSDVMGEHNETGGLQVRANGVKLMVSSDAAVAHSNDKLKDNAYEQTFHWGSYQHAGESGDN